MISVLKEPKLLVMSHSKAWTLSWDFELGHLFGPVLEASLSLSFCNELSAG